MGYNIHMETGKIKILLVDDDKFLLDMYAMKFQKSGLDVDTAPNGTVALEKLKSGEKPDVIVLDIIMPGMDGIEILKNIKQENLAPQTTIVMLTNQPNETEKVKSLGVDGYIVKATSIPSEVVSEVLKIHNNKKK